MPEIQTTADFWDCEIEHSEVKSMWVSDHLLYMIRTAAGRLNLNKIEIESALKKMAEEQAMTMTVQWDIGDKLLDFTDGSRLGIVAPAAGTMAGSSRVMEPSESYVRGKIRGRSSVHTRGNQDRMVLDQEW